MPVEFATIAAGVVKAWSAARSGLTPDKGIAAARALFSDNPGEALRPDALAMQACFRGARCAVESEYEAILREPHSKRFREDVETALANLPDLAASLPSAAEMMAGGYTPQAYAQALADRAVAQGREVFRAGEARELLTRCAVAMFEALDRDTAFVAQIERTKWAELYDRLASIKDDTAATRAMVERLTAELHLTHKEKAELVATLTTVREHYGAQEGALAGFLCAIVGSDVPPDQRTPTLFEIVARWHEAGLRLKHITAAPNLTPETAPLRAKAEAARQRGDVDATLATLAEIDRIEADADARLEIEERRALERAQGIAQERRLRRDSRVESKRAAIEAALGALRHAEAARLIFEEITLTTPPDARFAELRAKQKEFYVRGNEKGLDVDLERAIELAKIARREARGADERGAAANDLGAALATLGARESFKQRLEDAVGAFRAALKEGTRGDVPRKWAVAQSNLGNALTKLGVRESRKQRLEEAIAAHRAALEEQTRECLPFDWAATQNNLGTTLLALGFHESCPHRLKEAIAAFRAALEVRTREHFPLQWATTQSNLGAALLILGDHESCKQRLEEAVTACRAALEEQTRERVPLDWAMAQNNLGLALRMLGERKRCKQCLEEAVAAFRAAQEARLRKHVPLDWGVTQSNLGIALTSLGTFETGTRHLKKAIAAYREALQELTPRTVPHYHAIATRNLARAEALIASRQRFATLSYSATLTAPYSAFR